MNEDDTQRRIYDLKDEMSEVEHELETEIREAVIITNVLPTE